MSSTTFGGHPTSGAALLMVLLAGTAVLLLVSDAGVVLPAGAMQVLHELTHDARHALGVPCH